MSGRFFFATVQLFQPRQWLSIFAAWFGCLRRKPWMSIVSALADLRGAKNYQILFSTTWVMSVAFRKMVQDETNVSFEPNETVIFAIFVCALPMQLPPWKKKRWKISYACNQIWIIFLTGRFGKPTFPGTSTASSRSRHRLDPKP